jgi:sulfatase maturation enzyme AslB (radical SAM superfamily)
MCTPTSSRRLIEDWETFDGEYFRWGAKVAKNLNFEINPKALAMLFEQIDQVEYIYLIGGEPLLIEAQYRLLDQLIESKRSREITLFYSTNATVPFSKLDYYLNHFRTIKLSCSIDAFGELNHYIRFPTNWAHVTRNLAAWSDLTGKFSNLELEIYTTVQAYNVVRISDLVEFLAAQSYKGIPCIPTFGLLQDPHYFNISVLPQVAKDLAVKNFVDMKNKFWDRTGADGQANLLKLEQMLDFMNENPASPQGQKEFIRITDWFDALREQNILDQMPEFASLYPRRPKLG